MRYSQCISNVFDIDNGFGVNSTYLGVLLMIFWWDVKFKVVGRVRSEFTLERVSRGFAWRSSDLYPGLDMLEVVGNGAANSTAIEAIQILLRGHSTRQLAMSDPIKDYVSC